jgi:hypothetical protein
MFIPLLAELGSYNDMPSATELLPAIFSSVLGLVISIGIYLLVGFAIYKIAKKLEAENAWWAWVPVLNVVLVFKLGDKEAWYTILMFIPCVNIVGIVFYFIAWAKILEKLGKPTWHIVFFLIPGVNIIYMITLAL